MNVNGFQKNNVAFNGKNYVAPSLKELMPPIKEHKGYHLSIAQEHNPVKESPKKVAISLIKEKTGELIDSVSVARKNLKNIPEIIAKTFHFNI